MKAYPAAFVKVFWWILVLLALSGVVLIPNMLQLRFDWDMPIALPSGSRIAIAALHALFAFATLVLLGGLIPIHIRNGVRSGRQLKSGITLLVVVVGLPLTALGIYYFGNELWSAIASATHVAIGLSAALVLTIHVIVARRVAARMHRKHRVSHEHRAITQLEEHKERSKAARQAMHEHHRQRRHK